MIFHELPHPGINTKRPQNEFESSLFRNKMSFKIYINLVLKFFHSDQIDYFC